MIGRPSYGNPYIFKRISHYLDTGELLADLTFAERLDILLDYATDLVNCKGEYIAMKELRGQASWFIKGCKNGAKLRDEISKIQTMDDLKLIVEKALEAGN